MCIRDSLIAWAFGWRASLYSIIFFGTTYMMAYTHIRGAFLRLDWVTLLVMSTCLIKRGHYNTAGVLMAYAGFARMFPLVFAFGLGVKFFFDFIKTWKLNRNYLGFFCTFGATIIFLGIASVVVDGGVDHWKAFFSKIKLHDGDLSPMRVGFKYILMMTYTNPYDTWTAFEAAKLQQFEDLRLLWWAVQLAVIGVSIYVVRHLDDYETIPYGYVLAFFMTAPTFYYQVMVMVALLLFLPKSENRDRAIGVVALFALSVVMFILDGFWDFSLPLSPLMFTFSCLLMVLALYMMATALMAPWRTAGTVVGAPAAPVDASPATEPPKPKTTPRSPKPSRGKRRTKRKKR